MRWSIAIEHEAIDGLDDALAEQMLPGPIGDYTRGQRIGGVSKPHRQLKPAALCRIYRLRSGHRERSQEPAWHDWPKPLCFPANANRCVGYVLGFPNGMD